MKKYENFCRAYTNLKNEIVKEPPYDVLSLTGLVALYQIAFEQSWKMMKEILENHGYNEAVTGSPRGVIKTAYAAHMINDEGAWLKAMVARNNVAHSYNEDIALGIIKEAKEIYVEMLGDLKTEIEKNWLN